MLFEPLVLLALSADPAVALPPPATPHLAVFLTAEDTVAEHSTGRIEVELAQALSKKGAPVIDLAARYPPPKSSADEAQALVKQGKEAYDNLDLDTATEKLADGILHFIKRPELAQPKQLAEIFVYLGAAELLNGKSAEAAKELQRAAVLDPDLKPDAAYFGPEVVESFTQARAEVNSRPKGVVLFQSFPSGAQIEIDGKPHGTTPVLAIELPPGRHHVRVTRPGYSPSAKFPEIAAGAEIDVRLALSPLPAYAPSLDLAKRLTQRSNFDAKALPAQARQLGQQLGARFIVLGRVSTLKSSNKVEAQVWDVETGDRLREVKFDGDAFGIEQAAETLKLWIDRPPAEVVVEAKPNPVGQALKKPWVWAVAGAVVVAVGVGVALAAGPEPRRFDIITGIP